MPGLAYTVSGDARRPALLFLHGFLGSGKDWESTTAALEERYRCIAVDLPGHGSSLGLPREAYTAQGTTGALLDVLDALDVERTTPVGYSMGGRLALYLALHRPERCSKLLLESASPGIEDATARNARRTADEKRATRLETGDFPAFLRDWYDQPLFASLRRDKDLISRTIETRQRNDPSELARSLQGAGTGTMPPLWDKLVDLRVPSLAITGDLDEKFVQIARNMEASSWYMETISVPSVGHNVHTEAHSTYLELLRSFVEP